MTIVQKILVGFVSALHVYFLILEMFLWTRPKGLKTFRMTLEKAHETAILMANQGLYNGFLAAGLIWSTIYPDPIVSKHIAVFFLSFVFVAAMYGGYSISRRIFLTQGFPAIAALLSIFIG